MPCPGLLAARKSIEPKIGPMQGVQPAAKPKPTKNVPIKPTGFFVCCNRFSFINDGTVIQPATNKPIKTINIPAILWISNPVSPINKFCNHLPKKEALAPKLIKTNETPSKKKKEWLNNLPLIFTSLLFCKSLTLIPVMYDRYAGKIGKTQGDRKDNAPAPIAKMIPVNNIVSLSIIPIMS